MAETPSITEEQVKLAEMQKHHHMTLFLSGIAHNMIDVETEKYETKQSPRTPGPIGDTKFFICRAGSAEIPVDRSTRRLASGGATSMSFYVNKSEGPDQMVSSRVCTLKHDREMDTQELVIADGYQVDDAKMVFNLALQLVAARNTGEISHLVWDLTGISPTSSSWSGNVLNFEIDPNPIIETGNANNN